MANLNKILLIGRLTKDPELRQTPGGASVCKMRLATDRTWRDKDGTEQKEVLYVDVTAWARQADTCAEYLKKGSPVFVEGRLSYDEWEDKDGQKRSKHEVVAERVQFLENRKNDDGDEEEAPRGRRSDRNVDREEETSRDRGLKRSSNREEAPRGRRSDRNVDREEETSRDRGLKRSSNRRDDRDEVPQGRGRDSRSYDRDEVPQGRGRDSRSYDREEEPRTSKKPAFVKSGAANSSKGKFDDDDVPF